MKGAQIYIFSRDVINGLYLCPCFIVIKFTEGMVKSGHYIKMLVLLFLISTIQLISLFDPHIKMNYYLIFPLLGLRIAVIS